jgi:hypothetical protein
MRRISKPSSKGQKELLMETPEVAAIGVTFIIFVLGLITARSDSRFTRVEKRSDRKFEGLGDKFDSVERLFSARFDSLQLQLETHTEKVDQDIRDIRADVKNLQRGQAAMMDPDTLEKRLRDNG